jgi:hypothetical protein
MFQRVRHTHPQLYPRAFGHERTSPAGAERWGIPDFSRYRMRVPLDAFNVFDYHESRLFRTIAFPRVVHYHEGVVARAGGNKKRVVDRGSQVFRKPSRFSVHALQRALRVIDEDTIVRLRLGSSVHPSAVAVDVVAVILLQRADDSPVFANGHLRLVKVNRERRLLHVSRVAKPIRCERTAGTPEKPLDHFVRQP